MVVENNVALDFRFYLALVMDLLQKRFEEGRIEIDVDAMVGLKGYKERNDRFANDVLENAEHAIREYAVLTKSRGIHVNADEETSRYFGDYERFMESRPQDIKIFEERKTKCEQAIGWLQNEGYVSSTSDGYLLTEKGLKVLGQPYEPVKNENTPSDADDNGGSNMTWGQRLSGICSLGLTKANEIAGIGAAIMTVSVM